MLLHEEKSLSLLNSHLSFAVYLEFSFRLPRVEEISLGRPTEDV